MRQPIQECASRRSLGVLMALCAATCLAGSAGATALFTENFEAGNGLSDGNWSIIGHAVLSTQAASGAHGVGFSAKGSGGDLWSASIAVGGSTHYWVSVDYKETGAGGFLGMEEYNSSGTDLGETWIFGDTNYAELQLFGTPGTSYHHYVQEFTTQATNRSIKLKLEDFSGNGTAVGHVFFDNITMTNVAPVAVASILKWEEVVK